jgi:hypothetical protein
VTFTAARVEVQILRPNIHVFVSVDICSCLTGNKTKKITRTNVFCLTIDTKSQRLHFMVAGLVGAMLAAVIASVTFECFHEYLQHLRREAIIRNDGYVLAYYHF